MTTQFANINDGRLLQKKFCLGDVFEGARVFPVVVLRQYWGNALELPKCVRQVNRARQVTTSASLKGLKRRQIRTHYDTF